MSNLLKMDLRTKAAVFIAAILVVVMGLSTAMLTSQAIGQLETALLKSSILVGRNLVDEITKTISMGIYLNELEGLSDQLTTSVQQNEDLGYIFITDSAGKGLYRSEGVARWVEERAAPFRTGTGGEKAETVNQIQEENVGYYNITLAIAPQGKTEGYLHLGMKAEVVKSQTRGIIWRMLLIGVSGFVVATALIIVFVSRAISRPLGGLADTAREISAGRLILPEKVHSGDEIGELSGAFRVMVQSLTDMMGSLSGTSGSLQQSSSELSDVARNLSGSFGEQVETLDRVAASILELDELAQDLSRQAQHLSDSANESSSSILESTSALAEINQNMGEINTSIENISSSVMEMTSTFTQLAEGAEQTAKLAEESREAIARINEGVKNMEEMVIQSGSLAQDLKVNAQDIGAKAVKETLSGILSIQEDVKSSEQAMKVLNERVDSIGEIITVIETIAEQTNLLALNAAIISAQAGEEGKSFSVIASEIRDLSASTTESTKKISSLISSVQQEAKNYAGYVSRVTKSVEEGYRLGQQAEAALEKIVASADESAEMSGLIARVTREQAEASEKVSSSVNIFTERADEIRKATSEEADAAKFIRESVEKAKTMVERVYRSTEEQNKTSQLLNETVIKAEEIAGRLNAATEKEKELSGMIAAAVEEIKSQSHQNFDVVKNVNTSSEMLTRLAASLAEELRRFGQ
ncbi:MAG: HAMP domain-containing protein [bacterium]|nr:MAG: HAMP domain-containing protein [bacterium]